MNIPCKICGYESSEADKFCRQCGGQFSAESDFSAAATLSHGKAGPNPAVANAGTGRFPPSAGDVILGETERYHNTPQYTPPQFTPPPIYIQQPPDLSQTRQSSSWPKILAGFMKGLALFLLVAGLITATGMAVFFKMESERESQRRFEAEQRVRIGQGGDANSQAQDVWTQINEALRLINEAEKRAKSVDATLTNNEEKSIDLGKFGYPEAQDEARASVYGTKARAQTTFHNFNTVKTFYEKQFGEPIVQLFAGNESRKRLIFQASTSPPVLVRIEEVDETQVRITIVQTLLRFNKRD
ncbi:MAG: hypothetical protein L0220_17320 [Acidobacteria bacterium]|nr:hypothetical protein [Acidobacteriota bacterium]